MLSARTNSSLSALALGLALVLFAGTVQAQAPTVVDRVAVRFIAPETGGAAHPRFLTEREIALFARFEALIEQVPIDVDVYPERYVRAGTDRLVGRAMLASLLVQRGSEPPDLPRLALDARAELADRIGGAAVLDDALQREGLEDSELMAFLRDQVRALWYIDKAITPIISVSEDSLREAFRSTLHPFRNLKFEDARVRLRRWLVAERMRSAELEFLQSARARIKIATVLVPAAAASLAPNGGSPSP
ncbi:MAG: hypothetical protein QOI41_4551 [Myxococcales bacterium]|nr:hypothetical protein [Myxococcales bacterium]